MWDDLCELILAGVAWEALEYELWKREHVNPKTGKQYVARTFRSLVLNPWTWGHAARHHQHKLTGNWSFDPDAPLPSGVEVYRNTHDAVWTGDQAEKLKAELRRRHDIKRGSTAHGYTYRFTGLLICNNCRWRLNARVPGYGFGSKKNAPYNGRRSDGTYKVSWCCRMQFSPQERCTERASISDEAVAEYIDLLLKETIHFGDVSMISPSIDNYRGSME